jgi:hypothetical protein
MPRKPLELPRAIARAFIEDMRAFFAETHATKRDEITARQLSALRAYNPPSAKKTSQSLTCTRCFRQSRIAASAAAG